MLEVEHTDRHLCLSWPEDRPCLSSAIFNGGYCQARRVLNMQVNGEAAIQSPQDSLAEYAGRQGWSGTTIGLMTAASMESVCYQQTEIENEQLAVWLSVGLDNARRAGDKADWWERAEPPVGTINIIMLTSLTLSAAVMAEMLMIVTEAKCAVLQELNILSPVSGKLATGTGTDATVIVAGSGKSANWAGKHTRLGELTAAITMDALRESVQRKSNN